MPYARDTLTQLRNRTLADIATRLPGSSPFQRRTALNVLGTVFAGLRDDGYGYLDWIAREGVPFTSDGEYELGWAGLKDLALKPATPAGGPVIFSGNQGAPVSGAQQVSLGPTVYAVGTGGAVAVDGTVIVNVTALTAGAAGNAPEGALLTLVSPAAGIAATAVAGPGGLVGGADRETLDALRTRMLQRYAAPPQGGDLDDYVGWALAVPGVTRAWAWGGAGAGAVVVYVMMDEARAAQSGAPQGSNGRSQYETRSAALAAGDQLVVANALFPLRPAGSLVFAASPDPQPLPLALSEVPADATVRSAITTAFAAFIRREASPGGVLTRQLQADGSYRLIPGGVLRLAHLEAALAATPGVDPFIIAAPAADVQVALGQISIPGPITYL